MVGKGFLSGQPGFVPARQTSVVRLPTRVAQHRSFYVQHLPSGRRLFAYDFLIGERLRVMLQHSIIYLSIERDADGTGAPFRRSVSSFPSPWLVV